MHIHTSRILAALLLCCAGFTASAQETCSLPERIKTPRVQRIDCVNQRVPDSYALALSWSPQYCDETGADNPSSRFQCQINQFNFVVHGLWGQNDRARNKCDHPRNCDDSLVSAATIKQSLCLLPSEDLIQGEWQKHGTCTGMNEAEYFGKIQQLWQQLNKPDIAALLDKRHETTPAAIIDAFVKANQASGLQAKAISVQTTYNKALSEVHICYSKQFKYTACTSKKTPPNQKIRVALQDQR